MAQYIFLSYFNIRSFWTMNKPYRIKISAKAGDGIIGISDLFFRAAITSGYHSSLYKSIPSSIRSGKTTATVSISADMISSQVGNTDCLVLFDTSDLHFDNDISLQSDFRCIICSPSLTALPAHLFKWRDSILFIPVHILKPVSPAYFLLGTISFLFHVNLKSVLELINIKYSSGNDLLNSIILDVNDGYMWASETLEPYVPRIQSVSDQTLECIDGNQAICRGAIDAGCRFFSSYPISPATSIGDFLSRSLPEYNGIVYQAEDEIAAIGAVCGASFSGVKSMTASSGPGFSLMQEFISYLSTAEIPAVITDVMRSGPSSGIPTHHGQEDLLPAVFGGHGEEERIVLAPSSIVNCYHTTITAFNCAEQYACPVILLSSAAFAFSSESIEACLLTPREPVIVRKTVSENVNTTFERYSSGNSVFPVLPAPGISDCSYIVTGLEHDSHSLPSESPENHLLQVTRRIEKCASIEKDYSHLIEWDLEQTSIYTSDFSIAAWGADIPAVRTAVASMRKKGYCIAALYPQLIFPVCSMAFQKLLDYSYLLIIPESNCTGQYSQLIKMNLGLSPVSLTVSNGEPINPDLLEIELESLVQKRFIND